jgi:hypothetical protein
MKKINWEELSKSGQEYNRRVTLPWVIIMGFAMLIIFLVGKC